MAETIILPKLGITMTEGTITRWLKQVGDYVKAGEPLFEIETDKTSQQWECTSSGYLLKILLPEGETAAVAAPVAILGDKDEHLEDAPAAVPAPAAPEAAPAPAAAPPHEQEREPSGRLTATPRARRYAAIYGVSLSRVQGSGERGRIREKDVIEYLHRQEQELPQTGAEAPTVAVPTAGQTPLEPQTDRVIPYKSVRRTTGERVWASYHEKPHIYLTADINMDRVLEKVAQEGGAVSVSDHVLEALAKMLRQYPQFNALFTENGIELKREINIGYAVGADRGLLVPVLRSVDMYNVEGISRLRRAAVQKAKDGRLTPDDMHGGTFTISNLGPFGVRQFTSVINGSQVAILSVGAVRKTLAVQGDCVRIANEMSVTLAVDHRAIDGAAAAAALRCIREILENCR